MVECGPASNAAAGAAVTSSNTAMSAATLRATSDKMSPSNRERNAAVGTSPPRKQEHRERGPSAEGEGFEPSGPGLPAQRFSRSPRSGLDLASASHFRRLAVLQGAVFGAVARASRRDASAAGDPGPRVLLLVLWSSPPPWASPAGFGGSESELGMRLLGSSCCCSDWPLAARSQRPPRVHPSPS